MPIFAPRSFSPGEVVHSEPPFAWVLPNSLRDELCQSCCRSFLNLRLCKQCSAVKYCGKTCQKKDWRLHRLECKQMVKLPDKDNYDLVRLLGRVVLKIKDKNWQHFKTSVLGTEVSFDEIDSHYKEMTENPQLNLMYKEVKEDVTHFIGAENMPKDIDYLKIVGKVVSNTFLNIDGNMSSLCFFIGISKFRVECIANSSFAVSNNGLKIWANRDIQKVTDEITIPKRRFLGGPNLSSLLDGISKDPCKCSDCNLPYGVSVLSRILDEKRAFSVIKASETVLKLAETLPRFICSELEEIVDETLRKHLGVLGRTNILHLKLMALRFLDIGGRAWEVKEDLEDLEMIMRSMFGDFYSEMLQIYKHLGLINCHIGNPLRGSIYLRKFQKLESYIRSP